MLKRGKGKPSFDDDVTAEELYLVHQHRKKISRMLFQRHHSPLKRYRPMKTPKQLFSLTIIWFLGLSVGAFGDLIACDVASSPFCYVSEDAYPESPVFLARVVESGSDWRDVQILDVLRGEEERELVRIWDGPTAWCNGPFIAPASAYGSVGDSIICIANIKTETDTFSVPLNDYYHCPVLDAVVAMKIENGIINSLIFDYSTSISMPYEEFLNGGNNWSLCSGSAQSVEDLHNEKLSFFPNPAKDLLKLESADANAKKISIYSSDGQLLKKISIQARSYAENDVISISYLPKGLLIIKVELHNNAIHRRIIHQ